MIHPTASAFALLVASAVLTAPSYAGTKASISISFRDLDPASPEGARILLGRIENAAEKLCGGDPWKRPFRADTVVELREFAKCRTVTVERAVASLNAPLLRQAYAGKLRDGQKMAGR